MTPELKMLIAEFGNANFDYGEGETGDPEAEAMRVVRAKEALIEHLEKHYTPTTIVSIQDQLDGANASILDLTDQLLKANTGVAELEAENRSMFERLRIEQTGRDRSDARVAELEAAVRTLHALAESHFGVGTIDVPAMPELHRK